MSYGVFLLPSAERDAARLPRAAYRRCRAAILSLEGEPRSRRAKKLVGEDGYRIRVGDYRILYRIADTEKRVYVYRIKHRREAYR